MVLVLTLGGAEGGDEVGDDDGATGTTAVQPATTSPTAATTITAAINDLVTPGACVLPLLRQTQSWHGTRPQHRANGQSVDNPARGVA